jgi:hypothetical protein
MKEIIPIMFHHLCLTQFPQKVLVVRDDNQLEVRVALSFPDDA